MKLHRTTVSISRVSNAVFGNWPITSATYVSPLPEIMTTGKIHLSARWSRYQYYAPYPAKMRVLSRRARDASRKKMSDEINHPDRASERAGRYRHVRLGEIYYQYFSFSALKTGSNLRVASPPSNARLGKYARARIYLCTTPSHARVHNIERNNPWILAADSIQSFIYIPVLRRKICQSPRSETLRNSLFRFKVTVPISVSFVFKQVLKKTNTSKKKYIF